MIFRSFLTGIINMINAIDREIEMFLDNEAGNM